MDELEDLSARTETEIEYDEIVLRELCSGRSIKQALQVADKKYPAEAWLIRSEGDIASLKEHYIHLVSSGCSEMMNG